MSLSPYQSALAVSDSDGTSVWRRSENADLFLLSWA
jgi:hypothetical protein